MSQYNSDENCNFVSYTEEQSEKETDTVTWQDTLKNF